MAQKILIIDDDVLVLKTLKNLLTKNGYVVTTFKDPQEALKGPIDADLGLILCDIRMPGVSGIELVKRLKEIRKKENKREIPVIFITGYASEEAPIKALKLGAKDYILKPFDMDKLLRTIKETIG